MSIVNKPSATITANTIAAYTGIDNLEIMKEAVRYNRFLLHLVVANSGELREMIDFGAGCGTFSTLLRDQGFSVTSIEPDDVLRARLEANGLPVCASMHELCDQSAGYVFSLNVLEHIEDDLMALRILRKKLRIGGRLLIYVPAFQVLYTSMDRKVGHYRRYRRRELMTRLEWAGFTVESARYIDSLGFFATLAFRTLDRGTGTINRQVLQLYDSFLFPLSLVLDKLLGRVLGKNLLVIARRP